MVQKESHIFTTLGGTTGVSDWGPTHQSISMTQLINGIKMNDKNLLP